MRCNLEQTVSELLQSNRPITLADTFTHYARVAGFSDLCHDSIHAFERAMEKFPMRPEESSPEQVKEIARLRKEYWVRKLSPGKDGNDTVLWTCPCCHGLQLKKAQQHTVSPTPVKEEPPRRMRRTRRVKKVKRAVRCPNSDASFLDPQGASTSALRL